MSDKGNHELWESINLVLSQVRYGLSISGLCKVLSEIGIMEHRLSLSGYLRAMRDWGLLDEIYVKPAKVYMLNPTLKEKYERGEQVSMKFNHLRRELQGLKKNGTGVEKLVRRIKDETHSIGQCEYCGKPILMGADGPFCVRCDRD